MKIIVVAVISLIVGIAGTYFSLHEPEAIFVDPQVGGASSAAVSILLPDRSIGSLLTGDSVVSQRAELYTAAARADEDALTSLLDEAINIPDAQLRQDFLVALSLRIAELGPDRPDRRRRGGEKLGQSGPHRLAAMDGGTFHRIGSSDLEQARRLMTEHISLPDIRRQLEEWLDRRGEEDFTVYRGGVIVYN